MQTKELKLAGERLECCFIHKFEKTAKNKT